jgi:hypothetical protein
MLCAEGQQQPRNVTGEFMALDHWLFRLTPEQGTGSEQTFFTVFC